MHSFLLVTSNYHTARARRIYLGAEHEHGGGPIFAWSPRPTSFSAPALVAQSRRPQDRLHGVDRRPGRGVRDLSHVGIAAHRPQIPLALPRGMALGWLCLVLKDLAQALQPLMIRGAVDSFAQPARVFVRFAGLPGGPRAAQGHLPILDARDPHRHLARYRIRPAQRSVRATWSRSRPISTAARAPATSWRAPPTT